LALEEQERVRPLEQMGPTLFSQLSHQLVVVMAPTMATHCLVGTVDQAAAVEKVNQAELEHQAKETMVVTVLRVATTVPVEAVVALEALDQMQLRLEQQTQEVLVALEHHPLSQDQQ
jgi:hypothetical protein